MQERADRKTLEAWDDQYTWHPFTPHAVYRQEDPLLVVAAEGHELIDPEGRRYLDAVASIWCSTFGHRRPEIDDAIRAQLDRVAHATWLGNASEPGIRLAKRLVERAPEGITRCFFSDNGSTATEIAVKMAYQYWRQREGGRFAERKQKFLCFSDAYNGDTIGAVSTGGIDLFHATFRGLLFPTLRAPNAWAIRDVESGERWGEAAQEEFERILRAHHKEVAAVIMEPGFQGAAGIRPWPPGFLRRVRALTKELDVLLILDEVAAGCGRGGTFFACEQEEVSPDFLCLAKMITGGYLPLAATLTTERIFEAFVAPPDEGKTFFHGHTFTGNALAAAAALAVLDIFDREQVLEAMAPKIEHLHAAARSLAAHRHVGDVRCWGLAAGIELMADPALGRSFPAAERRSYRVCRFARERGVFLRPIGDTLIIMPPLSISVEELDRIVAAIRHGLAREFDGVGPDGAGIGAGAGAGS